MFFLNPVMNETSLVCVGAGEFEDGFFFFCFFFAFCRASYVSA